MCRKLQGTHNWEAVLNDSFQDSSSVVFQGQNKHSTLTFGSYYWLVLKIYLSFYNNLMIQ